MRNLEKLVKCEFSLICRVNERVQMCAECNASYRSKCVCVRVCATCLLSADWPDGAGRGGAAVSGVFDVGYKLMIADVCMCIWNNKN